MTSSCLFFGNYSPFTDWRPRCTTQYQDMISGNISSSLEHRMYLTKNAENIMKNNTQTAYDKNVCGPCVDHLSWNDGTMLREFDAQKCNSRFCSFKQGDMYGLGRHRTYYDDSFDKDINDKFIKLKEKENQWFKEKSVPTAFCKNSDDYSVLTINQEM